MMLRLSRFVLDDIGSTDFNDRFGNRRVSL